MTEEVQKPLDELQILFKQADAMGITYSKNISIETLRKRIADKQDGITDEVVEEPVDVKKETVISASKQRQAKIKEATKLIRIRVTNMNPAKAELPGEIFTTGNSVIGTVRKYVPFGGTASEIGYHVPQIILNMLQRRTFTSTVEKRNDKGLVYYEKQVRKEFAIEILDPLTKEELDKLAQDQRASGRV